MNRPKPRNSIVILFCSDALAIALGAEQVDQPANLSRLMAQHKTEPTFDEYLSIGDPYSIAYTDDGTPFAVENVENIKRYVSVCLTVPKDPAALQQASAQVAREVKQKLLGFFQPDSSDSEDSAKSPTTSPSQDPVTTASIPSAS